MKSKILDDILTVVSDVCEISKEQICSKCKQNDVVDARCIFAAHCKKYGIPTASIVKFLGRSKNESVNLMLANHRIYWAQSFNFRYLDKEVTKRLGDLYPIND